MATELFSAVIIRKKNSDAGKLKKNLLMLMRQGPPGMLLAFISNTHNTCAYKTA